MPELTAVRDAGMDRGSSRMDAPVFLDKSDFDRIEKQLAQGRSSDQALSNGQSVLPTLEIIDDKPVSRCGKPKEETFARCFKLNDDEPEKSEKNGRTRHGKDDEIKIHRPMLDETAEPKIHRPMLKEGLNERSSFKEIGSAIDHALCADSNSLERSQTLEDLASMARKVLNGSKGSEAALRQFEESINNKVETEGKGVVFTLKDGMVKANYVREFTDEERSRFTRAGAPDMIVHPTFGQVKQIGGSSDYK